MNGHKDFSGLTCDRFPGLPVLELDSDRARISKAAGLAATHWHADPGRTADVGCAGRLTAHKATPAADPCAICETPAVRRFTVATGGGCDYPACSAGHAAAVWLAIDASQAAEEAKLPAAPWPVRHAPDWVGPGLESATGTVPDLLAWVTVPAHAEALAAVRETGPNACLACGMDLPSGDVAPGMDGESPAQMHVRACTGDAWVLTADGTVRQACQNPTLQVQCAKCDWSGPCGSATHDSLGAICPACGMADGIQEA